MTILLPFLGPALIFLAQWFPVESSSTAHLLSQLTKTIKMALKSTEEERAILRARSAVQRFPVVEWRQRIEDIHRRSITTNRNMSGSDAWRPSDGYPHAMNPLAGLEIEEWDPDTASIKSYQATTRLTGVDAQERSSQDTTSGSTRYRSRRRGSFSTEMESDDDYFNHSSDNLESSQTKFGGFLTKANRRFAKEQRFVPDPFLNSSYSLSTTPSRPFGGHSRASSMESIVSLRTDSPLNKAIATVCHYIMSYPPRSFLTVYGW